jgi:threonine aldolase
MGTKVKQFERAFTDHYGWSHGVMSNSGSSANLLAVAALANPETKDGLKPGDEVIVEVGSHIANSEVGGAARLGGLTLRTVQGTHGRIQPHQVTSTVRPQNVHYARTTLLAIENTHNLAGGTVMSPSQLEELAQAARAKGLNLHIDGARIFNAAIALGVAPAEFARHADTLTFCLSKGLSAPVGSVLVGSKPVIAEARRYRKMVGGGMRQAGVLAAAGLVALRTCVERLAEDHRNARRLAEGLSQVPGISLDLDTVQSNIVRFDVAGLGYTTAGFAEAMRAGGVKVSGGAPPSGVRMVTHRHIDSSSIDQALELVGTLPRGSARPTTASLYG